VFVRRRASQLVGYLLLAIPTVLLPQLARSLSEAAVTRFGGAKIRVAVRAVLYAAVCGALVYLWAQGTVVLIRPIFTWRGGSGGTPTTPAIYQVQFRWVWLVGVAVAAAVARIVLEEIVARRAQGAGTVASLQAERWEDAERGARGRALPQAAHAILFAAGSTLLLAGAYENGWRDALMVLVITAVLGAWRAGLLIRIPPWLERGLGRIPAALRFAAAVLAGYWLASSMYGTRIPTTFTPLLFGALLTLAAVVVLFPPRSAAGRSRAPGKAG
jgi:hypothetical protein